MCDTYDEFLQRLIQYRLHLRLTQEEASSVLGITQSQFSKMELGKIIVPYKLLVLLMGMDWDVDYIITGRTTGRKESELSILLQDTGSQDLLQAAAWAIYQGMKRCVATPDFETKCELGFLKRMIAGEMHKSVLCEIRHVFGMAQIPMSENLGVNIKKYRMLEKEEIKPDAELLLRIYEVTGCKPSLFLDQEHTLSIIISDLWYCLESPVRKEILTFVDHAIKIMRL